ncbi:MAG: hypothetical protein ATN35_09545 [Epulopiscium sp. Nele67-Bin004]|nr:MAG: hypothetical protein ATN35_09545 [Epulopiscium sp. Nele67-Bin004]
MTFNQEQRQVIEDLENNLVVLASAGTGKTDTISARIANILDKQQTNPEEILCLTFTNKACKEMQERIQTKVGERAKHISIKTFHSWCLDIIRKEAKRNMDIFSDFTVYDEDDCNKIVEQSLISLGLTELLDVSMGGLRMLLWDIKERQALVICQGKRDTPLSVIIQTVFEKKDKDINYLCTTQTNPNEKSTFKSELKLLLKKHIEQIFNTYKIELNANKGADFSDLLLKTAQLFDDREILQKYQTKYKFIHVDEVQDTSLIEYAIIKNIFSNNKIVLCGDIFQTIYEWRGSNPILILNNFSKDFNSKEIMFQTNYRATKNLANLSTKYLQNAFEGSSQQLNYFRVESQQEGEKISFRQHSSLSAEATSIYQQIKNNNLYEKTCILARNNSYNEELSENLKLLTSSTDSFEFLLVDEYKFFRKFEIKNVIAFMRLAVNNNDNINFKRILKTFKTNISDETINYIDSQEYRELGIRLTDFLNPNIIDCYEPFEVLISQLSENNIVVFDVESTGIDTTEDEIIQIAGIKISKSGNILSTFNKLIKTDKDLGKSVEVHNITPEILQTMGEDRSKVLKEFVEFIKDSVIVGHNVSFDLNILRSELNRLNLPPINIKAYYDTLDIYRRFYANIKNHKLETLSIEFDTAHKPTHDAMDDILATSELLIKAVRYKIIPTSKSRKEKIRMHYNEFTEIRDLLQILFKEVETLYPSEIITKIVQNFQPKDNYTNEVMTNLRNFYRVIIEFEDNKKSHRDALIEILQITSLSNGDTEILLLKKKNKICIPIITVHQAKGLEFDNVFLVGVQEETFPSYFAVKDNNLGEEKRTFYVAITRAKKRLFISCNTKHKFLSNKICSPSRFLEMLPNEHIQRE